MSTTSGKVDFCTLELERDISGPVRFSGRTGRAYLVTPQNRVLNQVHPADVDGLKAAGFIDPNAMQETAESAADSETESDQVVADESAPLLMEEGSENPAINASDSVIQYAAENGVDLADIVGSGKGGRILKRDVKNAIDSFKN